MTVHLSTIYLIKSGAYFSDIYSTKTVKVKSAPGLDETKNTVS
jgi:hypothetical protein